METPKPSLWIRVARSRGRWAVAAWFAFAVAACSGASDGTATGRGAAPDSGYHIEFFSGDKSAAEYDNAHFRRDVAAGDHAIIRWDPSRLKSPLITVRLLNQPPGGEADGAAPYQAPEPSPGDFTVTVNGKGVAPGIAKLRQDAASWDVLLPMGDHRGDCRVEFHRPYVISMLVMDTGPIAEPATTTQAAAPGVPEMKPPFAMQYFANDTMDKANWAVRVERCATEGDTATVAITRANQPDPLVVVYAKEKPLAAAAWRAFTADGTQEIEGAFTATPKGLTWRMPANLSAAVIRPAVGDCFVLGVLDGATATDVQSAMEDPKPVATAPSAKPKIQPTVPPCFP